MNNVEKAVVTLRKLRNDHSSLRNIDFGMILDEYAYFLIHMYCADGAPMVKDGDDRMDKKYFDDRFHLSLYISELFRRDILKANKRIQNKLKDRISLASFNYREINRKMLIHLADAMNEIVDQKYRVETLSAETSIETLFTLYTQVLIENIDGVVFYKLGKYDFFFMLNIALQNIKEGKDDESYLTNWRLDKPSMDA